MAKLSPADVGTLLTALGLEPHADSVLSRFAALEVKTRSQTRRDEQLAALASRALLREGKPARWIASALKVLAKPSLVVETVAGSTACALRRVVGFVREGSFVTAHVRFDDGTSGKAEATQIATLHLEEARPFNALLSTLAHACSSTNSARPVRLSRAAYDALALVSEAHEGISEAALVEALVEQRRHGAAEAEEGIFDLMRAGHLEGGNGVLVRALSTPLVRTLRSLEIVRVRFATPLTGVTAEVSVMGSAGERVLLRPLDDGRWELRAVAVDDMRRWLERQASACSSNRSASASC